MASMAIWVQQALLFAIFLVSTAANSLALLVFCRRPGLRTISNRFVINLLATNVLTTCVLAPLAAIELTSSQGSSSANITEGLHSASANLTTATDALAAALSLCALLGVLLIAADQHHAVTDPLRCHARLLQRRPVALVAVAWLAAALAGALCLALRFLPETVKYYCQITYATVYLAVGVIAPAVAVCVVYARIYNAARSSGLRARAHGTSALQLHDAMPALPDLVEEGEGLTLRIDSANKDRKFGPFLAPPAPRRCPSAASLRAFVPPRKTAPSRELSSTEDVRRLPAVSSAPTLAGVPLLQQAPPPLVPVSRVSSLRCRISNASLFRYREESRAARVGASACALALLHAPHAVLALIRAFDINSHIVEIGRTPALAMVCFAAAASPFLFALRSRRLQREARRLFRPQEKAPAVRPPPAAPEQARAALELLRALTPGPHTGRSSFSSGASTQLSSASDE